MLLGDADTQQLLALAPADPQTLVFNCWSKTVGPDYDSTTRSQIVSDEPFPDKSRPMSC